MDPEKTKLPKNRRAVPEETKPATMDSEKIHIVKQRFLSIVMLLFKRVLSIRYVRKC
jgi:hypothetical protein